MTITFRVLAALLVVAGAAAVAPGQVELKPKLADEQLKKLEEALKAQAETIKELGGKADQQKLKELAEASRKSLAGVLTEEQSKRVDQLMLQASGPVVFFTPKVQEALQLSNE